MTPEGWKCIRWSAAQHRVPAHSSVTLYGSANILGAHKARLYLYL
jgi:uncharacterized protein YcfL